MELWLARWTSDLKVGYPSSMSPLAIYTPEWRETMWGKVFCLRKQHDDRDWRPRESRTFEFGEMHEDELLKNRQSACLASASPQPCIKNASSLQIPS